MKLPLKTIQKRQLIQNTVAWAVMGMAYPCNTSLKDAVCFWIWFKVLIVIYKALHRILPGYLSIPIASYSICLANLMLQFDVFQVASVSKCHLLGPWKYAFSVATSAFWNWCFPQIWLALILLLFRRTMKTWFFSQAKCFDHFLHYSSFLSFCYLYSFVLFLIVSF